MAKDSRKRKAERKQVRQEKAKLEQSVAVIKNGRIPEAVATNSAIPETSADLENYRLIFDYYNKSICELHLISDVARTNKLITQFKTISESNSKNLHTKNVIRDSVYNSGDYKAFYKGLPKDVTVLEASIAGTGRLFFFTVNNAPVDYNGTLIPQNYCCIVAVKNEHTNTD